MGEEGGINNEWLYVSGALFVLWSQLTLPLVHKILTQK
jgi:hypothetical protein